MKKIISAAVVAGALVSTPSFSAGWGGIKFPKIDIPGIKIPPINEWKIGGSLGSVFEDNKEALRLGTIGGSVLGPVGLILGLTEGAKTDRAKQAAKKAYDRLERENTDRQQLIKSTAERFPVQASAAVSAYAGASSFLENRNAGEGSYNALEDIYFGFVYCMVEAADANNADVCLLDYEDQINFFKRNNL